MRVAYGVGGRRLAALPARRAAVPVGEVEMAGEGR